MVDLTQALDSSIVRAIYAQYEAREAAQPARPYLGGSLIGKECTRALWYDFRWASKRDFPGRLLRLFDTGHHEEPRMVKDLRDIGATVYAFDPATGVQFGYTDINGHMRGHTDGAAKGIPGGNAQWHLLEFKTHSSKSFADLQRHGVEASKPQHFAQMQIYMGWAELEHALYMAKNKDTDDLYTERLPFDAGVFEALRVRAEAVIYATEPPLRLRDDPAYYVCKMCDHAAVCHGDRVPQMTCRSCVHATPERDGDARWSCARHKVDLPPEQQATACASHLPLPVLVQYAVPIDAGEGWILFEHQDTKQLFSVVNDQGADLPADMGASFSYYSEEISNAHRTFITHDRIEGFRTIGCKIG